MTVLLTGGSGFIGTHVLQELINREIEVVCLYNKAIPKIDSDLVSFKQFDLLNASNADFTKLFKETHPSHCLHMAWYTNHTDYLINEINNDWKDASIKLIHSFYGTGGKRFLGTGTCIEYDTKISGFYNEDSTPLKPNTLYAKCKLDVYRFLMEASANLEKSAAWARIFFVYGPNDRNNRLIPYIIDQLKNNKKASPRYGGLMRDYNFVLDLAKQLVDILLSDVTGAVNTGSGINYQIQDFFTLIGELMGAESLVDHNNYLPENQPKVIAADISKYLRLVNSLFIPTSLKSGLDQTINAVLS
ncbi:MAG: NAD(P)-dependent oxidoreductase [Chitinophagales bacterium]